MHANTKIFYSLVTNEDIYAYVSSACVNQTRVNTMQQLTNGNKIITCTNLNNANAGELSSGNINPINEYN